MTTTTAKAKTRCEKCYFGETIRRNDGLKNEVLIHCSAYGCKFHRDEWNDDCEEFSE